MQLHVAEASVPLRLTCCDWLQRAVAPWRLHHSTVRKCGATSHTCAHVQWNNRPDFTVMGHQNIKAEWNRSILETESILLEMIRSLESQRALYSNGKIIHSALPVACAQCFHMHSTIGM